MVYSGKIKSFGQILKIYLPACLLDPFVRLYTVVKLRPYYRELLAQRLRGKKIVHLLHIGKTGGTILKDALGSECAGGVCLIHLHPHGFTLKDVPAGDKVVFFVRDPIERFSSGFYSRKRMGLPRYFYPWSLGEKAAFQRFHTPNELAGALSSEDPDTRAAAVRAMKSIAHVRSSYWDWFKNENYFLSRLSDIFFVGFQENLNDDFAILKKALGLPETVALSRDETTAHRNPRNVDTSLDERAVENLRLWYAADYEFVSLCKEKVRPLIMENLQVRR